MTLRPFKNILFDLDGTLTDPKEGILKSIEYALEKLGRRNQDRESLIWCIGPPLHQSLAKILGSEGELSKRALGFYRERFSSHGMYENLVYSGIPETLDGLGGYSLFVATSKPTLFAEQILSHFNLRRYFKGIYGSETNGERGDKTELIAYLMNREGLHSASTVMIGDREHDLIGAKNNEITGLGVGWGYGTDDELWKAGAQHVFQTPIQLLDFFS